LVLSLAGSKELLLTDVLLSTDFFPGRDLVESGKFTKNSESMGLASQPLHTCTCRGRALMFPGRARQPAYSHGRDSDSAAFFSSNSHVLSVHNVLGIELGSGVTEVKDKKFLFSRKYMLLPWYYNYQS
jgi:hypothetical protein